MYLWFDYFIIQILIDKLIDELYTLISNSNEFGADLYTEKPMLFNLFDFINS